MEIKQPRIIGCIDLGTNSVRLLVVLLKPNGSYFILTQQKEIIRLGEGEFSDNSLTPESIGRATGVIIRLIELAKSRGAEDFIAVATSATRDASNGEDLCNQIEQKSGVKIHIISGTEEARLIWLGVSSGFDLHEEKALFIDIGGGSTEVIIGDQYETYLLRSLKLGAIRTSELFFLPIYELVISGKLIAEIRRYIENQIVHVAKSIISYNISRAFGSSGTIITLESVAASYKPISETHKIGLLTRDEVEKIIRYLAGITLKERRSVPGLNPDRADIIIAGAIILHEIMKAGNLKAIEVTSRSLRDGLLLDYLSRFPGFLYGEPVSVRERSVRHLGRHCLIDENHAKHVTYLALQLYDSGISAGIFEESDEAREFLYFAAWLHDTGQFISFSNHHQHSFYLITGVPLPGFHQQEVLLIGLITRYHRKKTPRSHDVPYCELTREEKKLVKHLSLLLRIAEHLDRSHDKRITSVSLVKSELENPKEIILDICCKSDYSLEIWAIEPDKEIFFRTTGFLLRIRVNGFEEDTKLL